MSDPVAPDSTASDKPADPAQPASATDVAAARNVGRPQIGDSLPAPALAPVAEPARPKTRDCRPARQAALPGDGAGSAGELASDAPRRCRRRGGRGRGGGGSSQGGERVAGERAPAKRVTGVGASTPTPVEARMVD